MFGSGHSAFSQGEEGSASVEYLVLTALVSLALAAAFFSLGEALMERYRLMVVLISLPIP